MGEYSKGKATTNRALAVYKSGPLVNVNITIYDQDFGLEYLTVSEQPEVLEGLLDVSEGKTRSNQKDVLTT